MENQFSRSELLIGKEKMERLERSRVAVFGLAVSAVMLWKDL